jgi:molybdopterin/thiamine biosynthesis adenylyltransferase
LEWINLRPDQLERYERQIALIGEENQEKIMNSTVVQVGAGGLGSPLAYYLVAAGVGNLVIFEGDTIDISNLGRQILYTTDDVGFKKAAVLKQRLESLNPDVNLIVVDEYMNEDNAIEFLQKADYLVDASDNFNTKFQSNDLALEYEIPLTIASIAGYEGQILSVLPRKTACYRCLYEKPPEVRPPWKRSVFNAVCGVFGSFQASEVLKSLQGITPSFCNELGVMDLLKMEFAKIDLQINPDCVCSTKPAKYNP